MCFPMNFAKFKKKNPLWMTTSGAECSEKMY